MNEKDTIIRNALKYSLANIQINICIKFSLNKNKE